MVYPVRLVSDTEDWAVGGKGKSQEEDDKLDQGTAGIDGTVMTRLPV